MDLDGRQWYRVHDPAAVRERVELCNNEPVYLLVHARRDAVCDIFAAMPQQSDYVRDWSEPELPQERAFPASGAWKTLPIVRHVRRMRQQVLARRRRKDRSLTNRRFYTPADLRI